MSWDFPSDSEEVSKAFWDRQYQGEEDCVGCSFCNIKLYFDEHGEPNDCPDCTSFEPLEMNKNPTAQEVREEPVAALATENPTAQEVRKELVAALGTENHPAQWMEFMATVTKHLPDILSPGRPSAEAIKSSPIGKLGFRSWQSMIEAPAELGGLAWNFSAWKAWRRAWATVQTNPWLRLEPLTSSEINTLANDMKRRDKPFPGSMADFQQLEQEKVATAEQKRSGALTAAQEALADARKALAETEGKLAALSDQLAQEKITSAGLQTDAGKLQGEIVQLRAQIKLLSEPQAVPRSLTRWEHLKAVFGL